MATGYLFSEHIVVLNRIDWELLSNYVSSFFEDDDMFWKWITCSCRDDDDNKAEKKGAKESLFWMNEYSDGNSKKGIHWVFRNLFSNKQHIICNLSQGILKNRLYCFLAFTFNFLRRSRRNDFWEYLDLSSTKLETGKRPNFGLEYIRSPPWLGK